MMIRRARYLLIAVVVLNQTALADVPPEHKPEIGHLLEFVRTSQCIFIRNGDEHSAADAYEHILRKYEHFADDIDSTERFIELSASRSSLSGKPYSVRCPEKEPQASQEWLLEELARFRKSEDASNTG